MKNIRLIHIVIVLSIVFSMSLHAQQAPQYTQYMYNTMSLNPAYTGVSGKLEATGIYRTQWVGLDGSPETFNFSASSPLRNEKIGIGINLVQDELGPSQETFFTANFSYTIPVGVFTNLSFGLSGGGRILDIDFSRGQFKDPNDPIFAQNVSNDFSAVIGAGLYLYSDKWYAGVSVPDFINDDFFDNQASTVTSEDLHYFIMGGYVFDLTPDILLKPAFLTKIVEGSPLSVDVSANFLYQEKFTLGVSYRSDDAINALAGFKLNDYLFLGYSYDFTTSNLNNYSSGTHEIVLKFTLSSVSKRILTPRFF
ncbi:MAG: hypothetical protein CVU07_09975 [Bacteroidetes bacterium HGW-Bacteroidetes-23]|nr:MAG: hypothetical protein CVU07_09975 [Bacteroidetes bacterium HGW-Bacteroidetes-23]